MEATPLRLCPGGGALQRWLAVLLVGWRAPCMHHSLPLTLTRRLYFAAPVAQGCPPTCSTFTC